MLHRIKRDRGVDCPTRGGDRGREGRSRRGNRIDGSDCADVALRLAFSASAKGQHHPLRDLRFGIAYGWWTHHRGGCVGRADRADNRRECARSVERSIDGRCARMRRLRSDHGAQWHLLSLPQLRQQHGMQLSSTRRAGRLDHVGAVLHRPIERSIRGARIY